jgi:polyhydroxyalkanoate synthesis regulator phasin
MKINTQKEQGKEAINNLIELTKPKQESKQEKIKKEMSEFLGGLE